jgi:nitroreductase
MIRSKSVAKLRRTSAPLDTSCNKDSIVLPKPTDWHGRSVYAALKARKTVRSILDKKISLQTLSNLLWAACGTNRKAGPFGGAGITAASASNSQEIEVYAATEDGVYLYESGAHRLVLAAKGDLRPMAIGRGQRSWGSKAPVRLVYVVNIGKFDTAGYQEPGLYDPETQKAYYYVDAGMIAENVYLFAASLGLASWFHNCDKATVARHLNLPATKRPLFGQTIGHPGKE